MLEFFGIPPTEHHAIGQERLHQNRRYFHHDATPFGFPRPLQSLAPERLPKRHPSFEGKLAKLQCENEFLVDQRGAESRAQTKEEHPAAFIASQRLHRSIIHYSHWKAKGGGEIETYPAGAKITRLRTRPLIPNQSRITNRDRLIAPLYGQLPNYFHQLHRCQVLSGPPLSRLCLPRSQDFYIRSAYING